MLYVSNLRRGICISVHHTSLHRTHDFFCTTIHQFVSVCCFIFNSVVFRIFTESFEFCTVLHSTGHMHFIFCINRTLLFSPCVSVTYALQNLCTGVHYFLRFYHFHRFQNCHHVHHCHHVNQCSSFS